MQRVIKFRGKSVEDGEWVYGDLITNHGLPFIVNGVLESNEEYITLHIWTPINKETVCQFTGLEDKNGVDIYEGDIVKRISYDIDCLSKTVKDLHIGVITWDDCSYYSRSIKNELSRAFCEAKDVEYELIGDKFDNPELL